MIDKSFNRIFDTGELSRLNNFCYRIVSWLFMIFFSSPRKELHAFSDSYDVVAAINIYIRRWL